MKAHGINPGPECPLFSELVPEYSAIEHLSLPSEHTVLLIVGDARDVSTDSIAQVAQRLLEAGLIWICAWGPDCQRVHDVFDEVHVGDGTTEPPFTLMSTWHSGEPLEEAVWFFVNSAFPLDTELGSTSYVAVTVADREWAGVVDESLGDLPAFQKRMVTQ